MKIDPNHTQKKPPVRHWAIAGLAVFFLMAGYWMGSRETAPAGDPANPDPRLSNPNYPLVMAQDNGGSTPSPPKPEKQLYVCPMMCTPPLPEPGKCPVCGMDLVAATDGAHDPVQGPENASRIELSHTAMAMAEIRTAPVERKYVSAEVRLFGQIDFDPAHMTEISTFMPGVIDRVYIKRAGQFVRWGAPLFDIYSTDLLDTQRELMELMAYVPGFLAFQKGAAHAARDTKVYTRPNPEEAESRAKEEAAYKKIDGIRHKLSILGMPKRDIDELMKVGQANGIATVYASMYGQVIRKDGLEGTFVNRGTPILTLADPKFVWLRLDAYESDYPWIRKGQKVTFETPAYPGERFEGEVVFVDPVFNRQSQTFSIGAVFPDQGGRLKSGMLTRAVVHCRLDADGKVAGEKSPLEKAPLVIPATAPLITGKRSVVYVATPGKTGAFEGKEVLLGPKAMDHYIVVSGLNEGERVVVNGNFKIDSAVEILARRSMVDMPTGHPVAGHQLPGGSQVMGEDYESERKNSRTPVEPETDSSFIQRRESDSVIRRRPGIYGDRTRQLFPQPSHEGHENDEAK